MKYIKTKILNLKNHPEFNEMWVQNKIAEDPSMLGLGNVDIKDKERIQKSGGRLDFLLDDFDNNRRYEVEIQLGKTDESHIIRTIEYWDNERKRYPQYDHCAVIVAEDITTRFLNVISLFNGQIPLIAIQMKAIQIEDSISLIFTKILDEISYGTDEDDTPEITDRKYWEQKSNKEYLHIMDDIISEVSKKFPGYSAKYNKHYIGLSNDGISQNFVYFNPRKSSLLFYVKYDQTEEIDLLLDEAEFDRLPYDKKGNQYRLRIFRKDIENNKELIIKLIELAYQTYMKK